MYICACTFIFISRCNQSFVSERDRGDVMSQHSNGLLDSFDDLNLAIDNTWCLSNAKTISQACVNVWIKGHQDKEKCQIAISS